MLALGHVEATDPFSWTAPQAPWINHEVLAELTLGATHHLGGGAGLFALVIIFATLTLGLAAREGSRDIGAAGGLWIVGALLAASGNSLALGFSARPQLFTLLGLVVILIHMRRLESGSRWAWLTLPAVFVVWFYAHGGVLLGLVLLALAAAADFVAEISWVRKRLPWLAAPLPGAAFRLAGVFCGTLLILLILPGGWRGLRWLVQSVSYTRPEITEWQPTPPDFSHATFWIVAIVSAVAWMLSTQPRRAADAAILALLLAISVRHQRHIPLFCLANLLYTPVHLAAALRRLAPALPGLVRLGRRAATSGLFAVACILAAAAALVASFRAPRVHPWTIEVERDQFPCAAIHFLQSHPVPGKLLVFFDWGQQALWELPENPVSFDGRLDTVYPRDVIAAHWAFYRGTLVPPLTSAPQEAEVSLLPTASAANALLARAGWKTIYQDPLATIQVRSPKNNIAPQRNGPAATSGREPFPDSPSARVKAI